MTQTHQRKHARKCSATTAIKQILTAPNSEKLKKLRYAAKAAFGEPPAADGEAPKTPAKRGGKKAAGETPAKSTGKRKSKKDSGEEVAKSEEGGSEESPSKKLKAEPEEDAEVEV